MGQDEAIKYNSLYQEVMLAISNIQNLGFDVAEYRKKLREIHNIVNDNVKVKYVRGMAEASYIQSYSSGVYELNKLKNQLDKYQVYAKAKSICSYIDMKLNDNISKDELAKLISQMMYTLKGIHGSGTVDYDVEKHIVESLYETAYNIIKLEIIMSGESQLYLFIKNDDMNISYFNNLVIKDIERIDLNNVDNKRLKIKLYELGQNGIYSNYLDLELLKLIILSDKSNNLKEVIVEKINTLVEDILVSDGIVKELLREVDSKQDSSLLMKIDLNNIKKDLNKKITSFALSLSLLLGGMIGIPLISRKISIDNTYIVTEDTYSSMEEDIKHSEKKALVLGYAPSSKEARLDVFDDGHIFHYDISEFDIDDPIEYSKYLLENNIYLQQEELDTIDYFDIRVKHYEKKDEFDMETYWSILFLLFLIYILFLLITGPITLINPYNSKKIKEISKKLNDKNVDLYVLSNEIKEIYDNLEIEINKNEKLRNKFNELYNANKFLLDNPEQLFNMVNDIISAEKINDAKKLIKDNRKNG